MSERSGSRTLDRWEWIAARVIPRGVSGKPEMEAGVLHVPRLVRDAVRTQLTAMRDGFRRASPDKDIRDFYKDELPPFVHGAWLTSLLEPPLPAMKNTDGEDMVVTQLAFDVLDDARVSAALASRHELEPVSEGRWTWSGDNREGKRIILGTLTLSTARLVAKTNSVARGERARALLDSLAADALRYRSTTHEDPTKRIRDSLRDSARGVGDRRRPDESALPKEVAETLVLDHMERHYRAWLDEPVPALDARPPRVVAREGDRVSRERPIQLLHDLEGMYLRALRDDEPAYDASWMWRELGLTDDEMPKHPPPLAHERIAELLGVGPMSRTLAERARQVPDFDDASTLLTVAALKAELEVQRFLRAPATAPAMDEALLLDWLLLLANFDLHRRKTFWVDESLAYSLDHSDVDVLGGELRAPFPSCAFVFTDRHVLSLAERALARVERAKDGAEAQPLVGQLLRVVTAYLSDEAPREPGQARTLAICFAVDALGADPPATLRYRLALDDEVRVATRIDEIDPPPSVDLVDGAPVFDASPVRSLLRIALNAVLYATNAGRDAEVRAPPARSAQRGGPEKATPAPVAYSSDGVYLLPGAIEISNVRHLQELERSPGGREYVHRFLVRGHWRRPAQTWSDQRLRWIAPYWKGPSLAATVERLYKMKP